MTVEQPEAQIERLPRQDLARLVGWLDRFLDRQDPAHEVEPDDLTDTERVELTTRREELLANPDLAQPMDEAYLDGLKRPFGHDRAGQARGR